MAVVTGTRAEYGILRPVMKAIAGHPSLSLSVIATGMHLLPEFGYTVREVERDFKVDAKVQMLGKGDSRREMAESVGRGIIGLANSFEKLRPDFIVVLGDRIEPLAASVAGVYMGIPVAHIHGGDISGNVDDLVRHAIAKLACIHFAATKKSASRLIRMGEEKWRVYISGAPALDTIINGRFTKNDELAEKYRLDFSSSVVLALQHPVTNEADRAALQMRLTLEALRDVGEQTILIYPNADAGGRRMIAEIESFRCEYIKAYKNIPYADYIGLMRTASVLVGNSSSGIIEAPSFNLSAVNIGKRQEGRERAKNVIDVGYNRREITRAIKKAMGRSFKRSLRNMVNPYGGGCAGGFIAKILAATKIDEKLLRKKLAY